MSLIDLSRANLRDCFCFLSCTTPAHAVFFTNGSFKPVFVPQTELAPRLAAIEHIFVMAALVPWEVSLTPEQARCLTTEHTLLKDAQTKIASLSRPTAPQRLISV